MSKHYYAMTDSSRAHDVALAFNSQAERNLYVRNFNGNKLTYDEAMKFAEIRHFYARTENDWFSQLYPRAMW